MSEWERAVNIPPGGGLIFFPPTDFADPKMTSVIFLSNTDPPLSMGERDKAVLRAYLTLALDRLDSGEGA